MLLLLTCINIWSKVRDISACSELENYGWGNIGNINEICAHDEVPSNLFGIRPFFINKGNFYLLIVWYPVVSSLLKVMLFSINTILLESFKVNLFIDYVQTSELAPINLVILTC